MIILCAACRVSSADWRYGRCPNCGESRQDDAAGDFKLSLDADDRRDALLWRAGDCMQTREGFPVGHLYCSDIAGWTREQQLEHGRKIVLAVNCHEDLFAACQQLLFVARRQPTPRLGDWDWPHLSNVLQAAIAKVETLKKELGLSG